MGECPSTILSDPEKCKYSVNKETQVITPWCFSLSQQYSLDFVLLTFNESSAKWNPRVKTLPGEKLGLDEIFSASQ